jgi:hypothetical protein
VAFKKLIPKHIQTNKALPGGYLRPSGVVFYLGGHLVKLTIVCSWCGRSMGVKECSGSTPPDLSENPVSHSICQECFEKQMAQIKAEHNIQTLK